MEFEIETETKTWAERRHENYSSSSLLYAAFNITSERTKYLEQTVSQFQLEQALIPSRSFNSTLVSVTLTIQTYFKLLKGS